MTNIKKITEKDEKYYTKNCLNFWKATLQKYQEARANNIPHSIYQFMASIYKKKISLLEELPSKKQTHLHPDKISSQEVIDKKLSKCKIWI